MEFRLLRVSSEPFQHRLPKRGRRSGDLFQLRERRWREDLVADACDDGPIALAVVADLVPSRISLKCVHLVSRSASDSRLQLTEAPLPWEYVR